MAFKPAPVPTVTREHHLAEYIGRELRRIGVELDSIASAIEQTAPTISGSATVALPQTFITAEDETDTLAASRRLVAGANVSFDYSASGQIIVSASLSSIPNLSGLSYLTLDDETAEAPNSVRFEAGDNIEFSVSDNVIVVSAPGSGVSIDDVRDALEADGYFRGEVIGTLWPGFVENASTEEERIANGLALQECIDYCVGNQYKLRWLAGSHRFQLDGGLLIRTVGVDNTTGEIVPAGTPGSTNRNPTGFTWTALLGSTFSQFADNTPIITIAPTSGSSQFGIEFTGGSYYYGNDQPIENTEANSIVLGPLWLCRIGCIRIASTTHTAWSYRGIYNPSTEFFFSNHLYDIKVFKARQSLLSINSIGTGNVFVNTYLSGVSASGAASNVVVPFWYQHPSFGQAHGNIFIQLNIEWCISNVLMQIANIRGITFNGVHFERNRLSGSNGCFVIANIADINFNGLMMLDNRFESGTVSGSPCWFRPVNDVGILINGCQYRLNTASYLNVDVYMIWQADASGWENTPAKLTINNLKFQDISGVIGQRIKIDRTLETSDFGPLGLMGVQQVWSCPRPGSRLRGAEYSRNYSSVLYGATIEDAFIKYPGSMSGTCTLGLSRYMGPAGTRHAGKPVVRGTTFDLRRSAGTGAGMLVVMNLEEATTLTAMVTGSNAVNFTFDGVRWVIGALKGSETHMVRYALGSTSVTDEDDILVISAVSGTCTVSLPPIADNRGRQLHIKKSDNANAVVIDGSGSETIDGATSQAISLQYVSLMIMGGVSEWHII